MPEPRPSPSAPRTLLVISQVYVPDPASVGQYMADAAAGMAARGWRVIVLTSRRGYDDPSRRYAPREQRDGVDIRRLPLSSFGKRSIPIRLLGAVSFLVQVILRGLFLRRLDCILVSTSPPIAPLAALILGFFRSVPLKYWAMDINPDQMIALGRTRPTALSARVFDWMNRRILRRADAVVTLDRYMGQRLAAKTPLDGKLTIIPPWPHEHHLASIPHDQNPFRKQHGLEGKRVITYSGNMSIASPLDTIVQAALQLQDEKDLLFLFIGGGLGKKVIDQAIRTHQPTNIRCLPYQELEQIRYSLSAADVHLVSMGPAIVGICHPSKVYPALAIARPILYLGPAASAAAEMIDRCQVGWRVEHGDVAGAVAVLRQIARTPAADLAAMGARARRLVDTEVGQARLCGQFCDVLEHA